LFCIAGVSNSQTFNEEKEESPEDIKGGIFISNVYFLPLYASDDADVGEV